MKYTLKKFYFQANFRKINLRHPTKIKNSIKSRGIKMNDKTNGLLLMVLGVLLAILYIALPTWLLYMYWAAILIFLLYLFFLIA
jgi:hypothetical protein